MRTILFFSLQPQSWHSDCIDNIAQAMVAFDNVY